MLSLTIGENGIIKKATQSGVAYEEAKAREKLELVLLDMQAEKRTNSEYNKEEYLTKKIEEQGMTVNEDIVLVDGWKFSIDRDIPQIGESLGKGSTNEKIKLQLSQTVSSDYVKSTIKVEIEYEGEITSIKIGGENIEPIPEKKDGKYIIEKEIEKNGVVSVFVKDKEEKYQIGNIRVSEITEDIDIWTKEDLELFRDRVNSGRTYEKRTVRIMANIDLKGSEENKWIPIGKKEEKLNYYFSGNLEGNNHTISNLYINTTNSCQGLFGYTRGNIRNIRLEQVNIEANTEVGSIAGRNEGTIKKCYVKGILKGHRGLRGGVVGINLSGNISQCVNDVEIITEAMSIDDGQYGGIVGGLNGGIVELCYNLGDIKITSGSNVGGIVGWVGKSFIIRNSYNVGEITGSATNVGGIIGAFGTLPIDGKIENCYNLANITGQAVVGNIIGYFNINNDAEVRNSYYLKNTKGGYGYNNGQICETIEKEEKDLKNSAQLLGDAYINDVKNEDGTWKYNNGYPILKWQTEN